MPVDRVAGALLGVHVGDSLGATTEFADRERARRMLPATVQAAEIVGGGVFDWPPGAATDDTDLTLALVRAYLETDFGTSEAVVTAAADHLLRWKRTGPRDIAISASWDVAPGRRITASFGVATLDVGEDDARSLMRRADLAMYAAKSEGRDRVVGIARPSESGRTDPSPHRITVGEEA